MKPNQNKTKQQQNPQTNKQTKHQKTTNNRTVSLLFDQLSDLR